MEMDLVLVILIDECHIKLTCLFQQAILLDYNVSLNEIQNAK